MPEKPEVITVAKTLEKQILGKRITGCFVYWDNIIAYPSVDEFKEKIIGEVIDSIFTRGKFIQIHLDHYDLLVHLRMEGKFLFRDVGEPLGHHEHVEFILDSHISFRYMDVRKFGKMYLIEKEKVNEVKPLSGLGLEFDDSSLTKNYLYERLHKKSIPIKTSLLDQSIITGIGNIYDDEILFLSHIHPLRSSNKVSQKECELLIENTRKVLNEAIKKGGTTIRSFTSSEGVHGLFQHELLVHGREGEMCPNCGEIIQKIRVGGRGTSFCPKCQK